MGQRSDLVPKREQNRRRRVLMEVQQRVVFERNRDLAAAGAEVEAMVEARAAGGRWHGRTAWDAPSIDGTVRLQDRPGLKPGAVGRIRVTAARGYDLEGAWIGEPA